jgi:uncharacterized protein YbjT (DUF2867 family)
MKVSMKVILLGASGMVGQGVLRECLLDPAVEAVLSIGRRPSGVVHAKLEERTLPDLADIDSLGAALEGFDACLDSLGISSFRLSESEYTAQTYDLTLAIAKALLARNPGLTFVYVSGAGTDASERGRVMWARVKGRTENALRAMPFKAAYLFRPGIIEPLHGIRSRTAAYRVIYALLRPLFPLMRRAWPGSITTTEQLGRAMLRAAREGAPTEVLDTAAINAL